MERRVRAVPRRDHAGCPFAGPGVDLRGEDANRAIAHTEEVLVWLRAREPGVELRTLSIDLARPRVLLTLVPKPGERPRALRFDSPFAEELVEAARTACLVITEASGAALRRRVS